MCSLHCPYANTCESPELASALQTRAFKIEQKALHVLSHASALRHRAEKLLRSITPITRLKPQRQFSSPKSGAPLWLDSDTHKAIVAKFGKIDAERLFRSLKGGKKT